jgi:hypothetical protein
MIDRAAKVANQPSDTAEASGEAIEDTRRPWKSPYVILGTLDQTQAATVAVTDGVGTS